MACGIKDNHHIIGIVHELISIHSQTYFLQTFKTSYMMLQVAYTASSPVFGEDKDHYPRFYRVVPVIRQIAEGCVAVVKKLHWKRIAIITGEDEFYYNVCT